MVKPNATANRVLVRIIVIVVVPLARYILEAPEEILGSRCDKVWEAVKNISSTKRGGSEFLFCCGACE